MNTLPASHPLLSGDTSASPLIRALRGERPERVPVWFMRQAGRSLPEYRSIRAHHRMLEACVNPELASEITLQPVRRHGVDAAIFFSDIVVPLMLAGVDVDLVSGRGPVFATPLRTRAEVDRHRSTYPVERLRENLEPIREAVRRTVDALGSTPLIGFAGAPFTLAAYLVEGGPSRDHMQARALMHADPEAWAALLDWVAELSGAFLEAQVLAGASAVQLFDSWAGSLSPADYRDHVAPASRRTLAMIHGEDHPVVPTIHFAVGAGHLLEQFAGLRTSAIGVDWRMPLDEASQRLGDTTPLQGNLDPAYLSASPAVLEAHLRDVLRRGERAPGHVLNLGHGVPPDADPGVLTRIVELAHGDR